MKKKRASFLTWESKMFAAVTLVLTLYTILVAQITMEIMA